ncbi:hypothetical protein CTI12_AA339320 [Artemisia annua]|uniref:Uncharacterized protein n=1 Tax=Artemisia annua TaxID=35608 RepID=A0A2U1MUM1_ARTAN|nr:hypothetical protein CTI12_AA339320 [Artemisia annua]
MPDTEQPEEQASIVQSQAQSSGSIGPFFVVMSVLMVVAILSCLAGRIYSKRVAEAPLDKVIKNRDCFGWLKGKLSRFWPSSGNVITLAGKKEVTAEGDV